MQSAARVAPLAVAIGLLLLLAWHLTGQGSMASARRQGLYRFTLENTSFLLDYRAAYKVELVLLPGTVHLAPSEHQCGMSCVEFDMKRQQYNDTAAQPAGVCNAWVWCGVRAGCRTAGLQLPYQGCEIGVSEAVQRSQPAEVWARNSNVAFVSGRTLPQAPAPAPAPAPQPESQGTQQEHP